VDRRVTGRRNLRAPCTAPAAVKSSKMPNKMLIDATHPEETRVVVVRGNRVEEFDFETAQRKQLRGNIYLAKVTRVEPSLQAAFIEYGGNRHGFLAFSEIHPDYYQIPVADRQRLIEQEAEEARREEEEDDRAAAESGSEPAAATEPAETATDRVAEPEFGAPEAPVEVSVEFPAAQPADIAGESVAATVEAWEPVAEVTLAEAEPTSPPAAFEATFEERQFSGQFVRAFQGELPVLRSRFTLEVPAGWKGKRVLLHFGRWPSLRSTRELLTTLS
jgi:Ribonuclease G/E